MPEPKIAQKSPYVLDLEPGRYAWCACGGRRISLSATAPTRGASFAR